ncbi:MAG: TIGR04255 family protein [Candidatus Kapabacteria bacterium]|nr:TIGR04255 family protein [Candidatus Kapabacteria bacterium]
MDASSLSKLKHPPIVEAVVDFDCDMPQDYDLERVQSDLAVALSADYPSVEQIRRADVTLNVDEATSGVTKSLDALRFRNATNDQIVQYRASGFSFNRLSPYRSFDDYTPEIRNRWIQFVELVKPVLLRTLRLRYINMVNVPFDRGAVELSRYLNCAVALNDNDVSSGGYLSRLSVLDSKSDLSGVVLSVSQPPTATHVPVIIDIAVQTEMRCELDDNNTINFSLELLRGFKNRVFASSITDEMFSELERMS